MDDDKITWSDDQIESLKQTLSRYPENEKPTVIVVGHDEGLLNNAIVMFFQQHGLTITVVTPGEAEIMQAAGGPLLLQKTMLAERMPFVRADISADLKHLNGEVLLKPEPQSGVNPSERSYKRNKFR